MIKYLCFFPGHISSGFQSLPVGFGGVGDNADVRCGDPGQPPHFAGLVHAHFHHGPLMGIRQVQQGYGNPDLVVKVLLGGQGVECGLKYGLSHTSGGGFPLEPVIASTLAFDRIR